MNDVKCHHKTNQRMRDKKVFSRRQGWKLGQRTDAIYHGEYIVDNRLFHKLGDWADKLRHVAHLVNDGCVPHSGAGDEDVR